MKRYSFLPPRAPSPAQAFVWNAQVNQALFILWHHWHRIASSLASELNGSQLLIAGMDTETIQSTAQIFFIKMKKTVQEFLKKIIFMQGWERNISDNLSKILLSQPCQNLRYTLVMAYVVNRKDYILGGTDHHTTQNCPRSTKKRSFLLIGALIAWI